jgi:hypothetical protein
MAKKCKVTDPYTDYPVRSWDLSNIDDAHLSINKDPRKQFKDLTGSGIGSNDQLMRHPSVGGGSAGLIPEVTYVSYNKATSKAKKKK